MPARHTLAGTPWPAHPARHTLAGTPWPAHPGRHTLAGTPGSAGFATAGIPLSIGPDPGRASVQANGRGLGETVPVPATHPLPLRRVAFDYPDDWTANWIPAKPEFAYAANSVSLLMPFAEPLFIKACNAYLPELDPPLRERTVDFARQETQHYTQHSKVNKMLEEQYPGLVRVERWMDRTARWVWNKRSHRFALAFSAGGETTAYGVARWAEKHMGELFDGADPVTTTLFMWHLAEEVEHKSACWDVYEAVDGSRLRYAWAMVVGMLMLGWFTWLGTFVMLWQDHRFFRPVTWFRMVRWSLSLAFDLIPTMVISATPHHHPNQFTDPLYLTTFLSQFDSETGTMPLWQGPTIDVGDAGADEPQ